MTVEILDGLGVLQRAMIATVELTGDGKVRSGVSLIAAQESPE